MKLKAKFLLPALFWIPAVATGLIAVLYARLVEKALAFYHYYCLGHPILFLVLTPALFVFATFLVKQFAPSAGGSGIPQVLQVIHFSSEAESPMKYWDRVSIRTMIVKILSSLVGVMGGASIGREGPTVQIASSIFGLVVRFVQKKGYVIDYRSFLIAGGSAGVAAAFNTPLAGITFAIEEIAESFFFQVKQEVMIAVIISGIVAQAITGDYLYFGHPITGHPSWVIFPEALIIGALCGIAGGIFALLLSSKWSNKILPANWWLRALICGIICAIFGYVSRSESGGAGYETVKRFMDESGSMAPIFGFEKFITTVLSYLSGMAGGIFSPCLSIGAGVGYVIGDLLPFGNLKVCALIGMVSFFAAVVQAPLTSVVIVMEMTDKHILIVPFMIAAYLSNGISKYFMPIPLYRKMAQFPHSGESQN